MYRYKIRHVNKNIDNFSGQLVFNPVQKTIELPKNIWIYWEGIYPDFVKKCIQNIRDKNPSYDVYLLSPNNVHQYSNIDFSSLENASPQQKSDLLRFDLLYHHGGIWLDASIILYENLDWIEFLMKKNQTESFSYYRKKNTINLDYPVFENWLLASIKNNIFFKYWYDELYLAIQQSPKIYIDNIKKTEKKSKDFFQMIGNLEYLVAYVACQKVLRFKFPSITLIDCDENAFYCQVKSRWVKEKILIDLAINFSPIEKPKLIKLAGKERNYLCQYYDKGMYFKDSLIDF